MRSTGRSTKQLFCFAKNLSFKKKPLPTTFLPSVKTLTKNIIFFLLAQVFFFPKKEKV